MWATFKYTVFSLLREKSVVIWALVFPLIMALLFSMMFAEIDNAASFNAIPVGIVEDDNFEKTTPFKAMVESLSEKGDDQTIDAYYVSDVSKAEQLLEDEVIIGFYTVDTNGTPQLSITHSNDLSITGTLNETILKTILDNYLRTYSTIETIAQENPMVLANESIVENIYSTENYTEEISIFANKASGSVRYFYALLGFASIMAASVGLIAITRTQGNLSAIGARRMTGALPRAKTLAATLAAAWLVSFICLMLAFVLMRFVLGINFGGRDIECIFGLLIASFMTTALGTFVGSIPKLGEGAKSGLLTALSCILALFAGLYGTSSQRLADDLAKSAPLLQTLNPAKQVSDLFYNLYFYQTLDQFFTTIIILLSMAAVLLILAAIFIRRQRYASL